jgi:hypothetical protein
MVPHNIRRIFPTLSKTYFPHYPESISHIIDIKASCWSFPDFQNSNMMVWVKPSCCQLFADYPQSGQRGFPHYLHV